ncbi:MAG: TIGR01777 family oxidoreductase [Comamonas sp.]|jgi:uncharacterized protein (TIGR01777 family)|uniref:TIGR01777 family oxidoreductase n=1 Tax=Comamonas sp. TaxID=34028 RepID=UPI00281C4D19|nr:TIGR01777 family oxidoreductase [Comamonas sp.]MDR0215117.1 TIGR01777 family oxidoreductase [Comamonas sp.]
MSMHLVFAVMSFQALVGAFDNFWHHELEARLPQRTSARHELRLHSAREAIYGLLFAGLAWVQWQGWWVMLPAGLLLVEMFITIADFLEEDRSRKLPPLERALHTVLAVSYGLLLGVIAPVFWQAAQQPSALILTSHGLWSWLFSVASAGVLAWSVRNALAVRELGRMAASLMDLSANPQAQAQAIGSMTVLVTGGTGFIGTALVQKLLRAGRRVIVLTRDPLQARAGLGPMVWCVDRLDDIPSETCIDAVVNLAGAGILGAPWTQARRQLLLGSRLQIAQQLRQLMQRLERKPEVLIAASAVGYYGVPSNDDALTESAPAQSGCFQSELCAAIEAAALQNQDMGIRVVCLRPGIVLGKDGGAYPALALAARLGLGATLGTGRQVTPWIHRDDVLGLIAHAMAEPAVQGPLNAVAPQMPSQQDFTRALAASLGRAAWLHLPAWPLRLGLGEMSQLLLCGQNAVPTQALASGYRFTHASLESALAALAHPTSEQTTPATLYQEAS